MPAVFIGVTIVVSVLFRNLEHIPFVIYGVYFGWFYLRFLQKTGDSDGDRSEDFAFVTFFPSAMQYVLMKKAYNLENLFL